MARWSTGPSHGHVYRRVGGPLDDGDVAAFLAVSVSHSGWAPGRWWRLMHRDRIGTVAREPDRRPIVKLHHRDDDAWRTTEVECDRWEDATASAIDHVWGPASPVP